MTRKPGVFDPWRQEAPAPPPQALPANRIVDSPEENAGAGQWPIRFAGRRAGVVVWLNEGDAEQVSAQAKTNILVALEKLMSDHSLDSIFSRWGITKTEDKGSTKISDGPRSVFIRGDYEASLDAISFAFREAGRVHDRHEKYITSLGIRPYVR